MGSPGVRLVCVYSNGVHRAGERTSRELGVQIKDFDRRSTILSPDVRNLVMRAFSKPIDAHRGGFDSGLSLAQGLNFP